MLQVSLLLSIQYLKNTFHTTHTNRIRPGRSSHRLLSLDHEKQTPVLWRKVRSHSRYCVHTHSYMHTRKSACSALLSTYLLFFLNLYLCFLTNGNKDAYLLYCPHCSVCSDTNVLHLAVTATSHHSTGAELVRISVLIKKPHLCECTQQVFIAKQAIYV